MKSFYNIQTQITPNDVFELCFRSILFFVRRNYQEIEVQHW